MLLSETSTVHEISSRLHIVITCYYLDNQMWKQRNKKNKWKRLKCQASSLYIYTGKYITHTPHDGIMWDSPSWTHKAIASLVDPRKHTQ